MPEIHVGTCGFSFRQQEYFQKFSVIELQQAFYQPPQLATAQRWRKESPENFEFTLKAFQAITHPGSSPTYRRCKLSATEREQCGSFRGTKVVRQAWKTTLALARVLKAKVVVFQCPASFRPTQENLNNLRRFLQWAERDPFRFGWEPRGADWTPELVRDLCSELDLVHVVDPFQQRAGHGSPRYFRLHGIGGYRYHFSDQELHRLRGFCTARLTYCMFNNIAMGEDALRFLRLLTNPGD